MRYRGLYLLMCGLVLAAAVDAAQDKNIAEQERPFSRTSVSFSRS